EGRQASFMQKAHRELVGQPITFSLTPDAQGVGQQFAFTGFVTDIVVASDNDPFCPVRLATAYSRAWGSDLVKLVGAGHINVESGHGDWPLGWGLLQALQEESTERQPCEPLYASIE
ncbi:MAG: RBBP9/YdeN family alpha/beta hydrolase, partial [Burkholderiaceae bacterium]